MASELILLTTSSPPIALCCFSPPVHPVPNEKEVKVGGVKFHFTPHPPIFRRISLCTSDLRKRGQKSFQLMRCWSGVSIVSRRETENSPAVHCRESIAVDRVPKGRLNTMAITRIRSRRTRCSMNLRTDVRYPKGQLSLRDSDSCCRDPAVNCRAILGSPYGRVSD